MISLPLSALLGEGDRDLSQLNHQRISVKLDLVGESWGIQSGKLAEVEGMRQGWTHRLSINRTEKTEGPLLSRPTMYIKEMLMVI